MTIGVMVCFVFVLAAGMIVFPYAPIRQDGSAFIDKLGRPHTAEYYWWFRVWQPAYIMSWIAFSIVCVLGAIQHRRKSRPETGDAQAHPSVAPPKA